MKSEALSRRLGWVERWLKTSPLCDRVFNCAYVTRQIEQEQQEEAQLRGGWQPEYSASRGATDYQQQNLAVELYRKFLFDEDECFRRCDDEISPYAAPRQQLESKTSC